MVDTTVDKPRTIKTGDTVQLKSGGPKMTVRQITEGYDNGITVYCDWFDTNDAPCEKVFNLNQLK